MLSVTHATENTNMNMEYPYYKEILGQIKFPPLRAEIVDFFSFSVLFPFHLLQRYS